MNSGELKSIVPLTHIAPLLRLWLARPAAGKAHIQERHILTSKRQVNESAGAGHLTGLHILLRVTLERTYTEGLG